MLPQEVIPRFRQNKISGLSIAWAQGTWSDEEGCYLFLDDTCYDIHVTDQWLMENGVTEEDLLDCVSQIEESFGPPDEYRKQAGLFKNSGLTNPGTVIQSRTCPAISCIFTPTSTQFRTPDAYFEWYFDTSNPSVTDLTGFMHKFSTWSGMRTTNVTPSPVMPSYMEAQEFFHVNRYIPESANFLAELWKYHRTTSKGYKQRLNQELLPQWVKIRQSVNPK